MGAPVVIPSNTPERISTVSASSRADVREDVPGRLRSSSGWISAAVNASRAGHPSMTAPTAGPWLSPKVVTAKFLPKVFMPVSPV